MNFIRLSYCLVVFLIAFAHVLDSHSIGQYILSDLHYGLLFLVAIRTVKTFTYSRSLLSILSKNTTLILC